MKIFFLVLLLFLVGTSFCQQSSDSLLLKIESYKDTINKISDGKIELSLKNMSKRYPVIVPHYISHLMAYPKELNSYIYYEIIYSNGLIQDTIFKKILDIYEESFTPITFDVLQPSKSIKVWCILEPYYLKRLGTYKVRFGFNASLLNKFYQDIHTDWISLYLKNIDYDKAK